MIDVPAVTNRKPAGTRHEMWCWRNGFQRLQNQAPNALTSSVNLISHAEKKAAMLAEVQAGMEDLKAERTRKASAREILDGVRKKKNKK